MAMDQNKKLKKNEEEENASGWMTTYSDMMTLLFAFFVLLFAISSADPKKTEMIGAALSSQGLTTEKYADIVKKYPSSGDSVVDLGLPPETKDPTAGGGSGNVYIDRLYNSFLKYIDENDLAESVSLETKKEAMLITIKNDIWFESGSAEINDDMMESATMLARLFKDLQNESTDFHAVITGHTDNVPMKTSVYPSNWELSVARAVSFLHVLVQQNGLAPSHFSARGYGEASPIADNGTAEGRQQNRRVEMLVTMPMEE